MHPTFNAASHWMDLVAEWMSGPSTAHPIRMDKPTDGKKHLVTLTFTHADRANFRIVPQPGEYVEGRSYRLESLSLGDGTETPAPSEGSSRLYTLHAVWEPKQISVTVPTSITYVVKPDGSLIGPSDGVARIENGGETSVEVKASTSGSDTWSLVSEGTAPAAHQVALGMTVGGGSRVDLSTLDGTSRLAKVASGATAALSGLTGRAGTGIDVEGDRLGCILWKFAAVRADG
jgi:hypothetical protein